MSQLLGLIDLLTWLVMLYRALHEYLQSVIRYQRSLKGPYRLTEWPANMETSLPLDLKKLNDRKVVAGNDSNATEPDHNLVQDTLMQYRRRRGLSVGLWLPRIIAMRHESGS